MIALGVAEALESDVGRGIARLDPALFAGLDIQVGDIVAIVGSKQTVAKVLPLRSDQRGQDIIQLDGTTRTNAGVSLGERVEITNVTVVPAEVIALQSMSGKPLKPHLLLPSLRQKPVTAEDIVRIERIGASPQHYRVIRTQPDTPVIITDDTHITLIEPAQATSGQATPNPFITYEDIGGLDREIQRVREMVELPMRFPQVFQHLGITPPKGLLLYGPPGSGKTLIARALAHETNAHFSIINGPEIIDKFYGQSEGALRAVFEEARQQAPAIIFIDEIDAIAPPREQVQGEVEKRVVAQLLTLMDGLEDRGEIVVIGATNLPDRIDPALRRPGRFDREIGLRVPDRNGRSAILQVHTRGMPLAHDVNLDRIATDTHGYVGADLQALCREAAMSALRRFLNEERGHPSLDDVMGLSVDAQDFNTAMQDIIPSTTRGVFVEVPNVRWEDVGGLAREKRILQQALEWPVRYAEVFAAAALDAPHGILLSGPPGTGKTLLVKAVANALNINFISVRGPEVMSKWVGDSEQRIRELFRTARMAMPCVIFFDEFDSIAPIRSGADPVAERIVAQLLTEMDGLEDRTGVTVIAATNRPDLIDPALRRPGRLDIQLEIGLPDAEARSAILEINLEARPIAADLAWDDLVAATEGWSGAEISELCRQAALNAVSRHIQQDTPLELINDDFDLA